MAPNSPSTIQPTSPGTGAAGHDTTGFNNSPSRPISPNNPTINGANSNPTSGGVNAGTTPGITQPTAGNGVTSAPPAATTTQPAGTPGVR